MGKAAVKAAGPTDLNALEKNILISKGLSGQSIPEQEHRQRQGEQLDHFHHSLDPPQSEALLAYWAGSPQRKP